MKKKNGNGKRTVKDLPPRKGQDVKGGDKAAAPVLGNTWGDSPKGNIW